MVSYFDTYDSHGSMFDTESSFLHGLILMILYCSITLMTLYCIYHCLVWFWLLFGLLLQWKFCSISTYCWLHISWLLFSWSSSLLSIVCYSFNVNWIHVKWSITPMEQWLGGNWQIVYLYNYWSFFRWNTCRILIGF